VVLVQFPYDSSDLPEPRDDAPQTMDPVLDAVAKAIAQDPSCRVCIIGHASEEGPVDYNDQLSSRRASAVERYLNARGLAGKKMPTVGLGSRCQLVPEVSRPLNRRVEFRRLQEGESCPTDCSQ
jgi:outer membrane protein OmpA-like peptidoglycan-associated protein